MLLDGWSFLIRNDIVILLESFDKNPIDRAVTAILAGFVRGGIKGGLLVQIWCPLAKS